MKKNKVLFFDNCLFDKCNFNCKYCRDNPSPLINNDQLKFLKQNKSAIRIINNNANFVIFKISGYGEITLLKNFLKILPKNKVCQIITNGSLLNKKIINEIAAIPNTYVCISFDGHTAKMNSQRVRSLHVQEAIISNIKYLVKKKIPIEINSVLTNKNTKDFYKFLSFLKKLSGNITCYPFPVRQFGNKTNSEIKPNKNDILKFQETVVNNYDKYQNILPPKAYLLRLIKFYKQGQRLWTCYVPLFNLGLIPKGEIVDCPCGANTIKCHLFSKNLKNEINKKNELISTPKNFLSAKCKNCFTHYEVINLYLENKIKYKSLKKISLFNTKTVFDRLKEIKKKVGAK